jgi:hypothetical protein
MPDTATAARQLLTHLPDPAKDREGQTEVLEALLDESLAGDLGKFATDADLRLDRLRERALEKADAILSGAEDEWEEFKFAREEEAWFRPGRRPGERLPTYTLRLLNLFGQPHVAVPVLQAIGGVFTLVWAVLFAVVESNFAVPLAFAFLGLLLLVTARPVHRRLRLRTRAGLITELAEGVAGEYVVALRESGVTGWVRVQINEAGSREYDTELFYGDKSGLAEVDDWRHEISTVAKERLVGLIGDEAMPGGAIGLAGPRAPASRR